MQYGTQTIFCGNMTKALRNHKVRTNDADVIQVSLLLDSFPNLAFYIVVLYVFEACVSGTLTLAGQFLIDRKLGISETRDRITANKSATEAKSS